MKINDRIIHNQTALLNAVTVGTLATGSLHFYISHSAVFIPFALGTQQLRSIWIINVHLSYCSFTSASLLLQWIFHYLHTFRFRFTESQEMGTTRGQYKEGTNFQSYEMAQ